MTKKKRGFAAVRWELELPSGEEMGIHRQGKTRYDSSRLQTAKPCGTPRAIILGGGAVVESVVRSRMHRMPWR